jgi:hypothetical protein
MICCRFKPLLHGFAPWKGRLIPKREQIRRRAVTSSQPERAGQRTPRSWIEPTYNQSKYPISQAHTIKKLN